MPDQQIPHHYHFIWLGKEKPYFLIIAIQSVLLRCSEAKVTLWADTPEKESPGLKDLLNNQRFGLEVIDVETLALQLPEGIIRSQVQEILQIAGTKTSLHKTSPIERSRSNLLRYMILYLHGGVYLDADTIVLKDLEKLNNAHSGYIGKENSVWAITRRSNPLHRYFWAPLLEVVRWLAVQFPGGYRWNAFFSAMCGTSENNAVMGLTPFHPYLEKCFEYISGMTKEEIVRPLRLGPFLLQRVAQKFKDLEIKSFPRKYFYPYGPLISQHFFRPRKNAQKVAQNMIAPETHVIHWGASTKVLKTFDRETLIQKQNESVFTYLCNEVIREYEAQ